MPQGQFPVINAGTDFTAGLIQSLAPSMAWKAADTPRSSTITLANDPDLTVPVAANGSYLWIAYLTYEGGTQGSSDLKFQWTGPSGATASYTYIYYPNSGGVGANTNIATPASLSSAKVAGTDGAGVKLGIIMIGTLFASSTPGNLQFQWAQSVSSATATILHAGSVVGAWRMQ